MFRRLMTVIGVAFAIALLELLLIVSAASPAAGQAAQSWTFSCKKNGNGQAVAQPFTVPSDAPPQFLHVVAIGGGGSPGSANASQPNAPGGAAGAGGIVDADVAVFPGETIDFTVGCGAGTSQSSGFSPQGAPGGGNGGSGGVNTNSTQGGGGGGATLVSAPGAQGFNVVAGGGGGGGAALFPQYSKPGAGGSGGNPPGRGGNAPGAPPGRNANRGGGGGSASGPNGQAGFKGSSNEVGAGGGGGGGCRGGGGGDPSHASALTAGGGGGGGSSCVQGNYISASAVYSNGRNLGGGFAYVTPVWRIGCTGKPVQISIPQGPFQTAMVTASGGRGESSDGNFYPHAPGGGAGWMQASFAAGPGSVIKLIAGCDGNDRVGGYGGGADGGLGGAVAGGGGGASSAQLINNPNGGWDLDAGGGGGGGSAGYVTHDAQCQSVTNPGGGAGGYGGLNPSGGASGDPGPSGGRTPGGGGGSLSQAVGGIGDDGVYVACPNRPLEAALIGGDGGGGGGGCLAGGPAGALAGAGGLGGGNGGSAAGAGGGGGGGGKSCVDGGHSVRYADGYSGPSQVEVRTILASGARPDGVVDGVGENVYNASGSRQNGFRSTTGNPIDHSIKIENDGSGTAPFEIRAPKPPPGFAVVYSLSEPSRKHIEIRAGRGDIIALGPGQSARLKMHVTIVGARPGAVWRARFTMRRFHGPPVVDVVRAVTSVR